MIEVFQAPAVPDPVNSQCGCGNTESLNSEAIQKAKKKAHAFAWTFFFGSRVEPALRAAG